MYNISRSVKKFHHFNVAKKVSLQCIVLAKWTFVRVLPHCAHRIGLVQLSYVAKFFFQSDIKLISNKLLQICISNRYLLKTYYKCFAKTLLNILVTKNVLAVAKSPCWVLASKLLKTLVKIRAKKR